MNIGYVFMILAAVIAVVSGFVYGWEEIWWMALAFAVIFTVVLFTRKKR